ncbi:aldehyde dehydrogenase (NADP(+)) [Acidocella aminolytica]|jgi:NADP-dependent aldehyde dehydrogenase|uniref:Aldehyde dehydrogenase n=1 Tax=Acidocella aminolytica 101 = DSM 11237 TaxID=1120923 RepID=A0A0D6PEI6_9PROT|nr:aldehyde dehydrogenase (NADP(+)) [Acidocella aminolytica]GAN79761.1 aldehyde dehydrogenase [Acidocella aminolytica 101 = DSM 11237]GBQ40438.1 NAD-dependent aldehyde dehydrogenase [Acidocella aminolytica 101 = DSM 11237]SHF54098.1 NADP-dependent aldehyde dehydrogenase [Acidocella aminolytica 101 = DSM 11237]
MDGLLWLNSTGMANGPVTFHGYDAASGVARPRGFGEAGPGELQRACDLAEAAFNTYRATLPEIRAAFLEDIGTRIMALGDALVNAACAESGLPRGRIEGERARTVNQLKMFAGVLRAGRWLDVRIDPSLPERQPLPRSDLRLRNIPLGPVAVFGASNFPLAFSVAGGDTASALAAGCPVVVKAHPAHPETSALVGEAIGAAVKASGLPEGVFSLLFGARHELGGALVAEPRIKAVGFTGSRAGGLALCAIAAKRREPIPVYAEMSAVNPVLLLPAALKARGAALGKAFVASLTMGAGQFCTNPGLLLAVEGEELEDFIVAAQAALAAAPAQTMLTAGIRAACERGVAARAADPALTTLANGPGGALFAADAASFLANPALGDEIFGPAGLLVRCPDEAARQQVLEALEGQLTATLHMDEADRELAHALLPLLEQKAGRILANGWPTGVEVCNGMVHGGPFPATSDARSTSVGAKAIERFLRPVCYQDLDQALLPPELRDENPLGLPRLLDGVPG